MSQKANTTEESRLDALRAKYPDHKIVEFNDGKVAVISKPNRTVVGLMSLNNRDRGPLSAIDTLLKNCWVEGDEIVKEDPGYALGLLQYLDEFVGTKTAELKN